MGSAEIKLDFPWRVYEEGRARFIAPIFESTEVGEPKAPAKTPVFYNPYSKLSRDLTVIALNSVDGSGLVAAEPLAGCGVRGIRLLLETSTVGMVHLNDINGNAVRVMEINSHINNVSDRISISHGDANIFLAGHSLPQRRFHYVDIDPVGSPSRFVENGLRACRTGGLIGLSATDLASLVGRHQSACLRKYDALTFACDFSKELALRIMAGFVVRRGLPLNIATTPKLSIYHRHFIRVFFSVERGRGRCLRLIQKLGWLQHCGTCLTVEAHKLSERPGGRCGNCGGPAKIAGPLWLGPLHDSSFAASLRERSGGYPQARKILAVVVDEVEQPGFMTVRTLARRFHAKPVSPRRLVEALRSSGFQASLTHVDPEGVKTNASVMQVGRLMAGL